jgi:hypothetical protein
MPWWPSIGDEPRQGERQGQAAKRPDPPSWESNVGKGTATKAEAQEEVQFGLAAELRDRYGFGCCAQLDQHGRGVHRVSHGPAGATCRQAFLGIRSPACAVITQQPQDQFRCRRWPDHSNNNRTCRLCQLSVAGRPTSAEPAASRKGMNAIMPKVIEAVIEKTSFEFDANLSITFFGNSWTSDTQARAYEVC